MSATNRGSVRHARDFYATPEPCIRVIMQRLQIGPGHHVFDPCCGDGRIVRIAKLEFKADACGWDIEPLSNGCNIEKLNSLCDESWPTDVYSDASGKLAVILTNPPYSLALEFVKRALFEVPGRLVCMLLPVSFMASKKRAQFHRENPSKLFVLSKRPSFTANGKTDACEYAWFVLNYNGDMKWETI